MRAIRRVGAIVVSMALFLGALMPAAVATHGLWTGTFREYRYLAPNNNDSRDYWVYVPAKLPPGPRPLYVYLHGCTQAADGTVNAAARGIKLNNLADREKFIVVYPEQQTDQTAGQASGNGIQCWNWFYPNRLSRSSGEPSTIAGITRRVANASASHLLKSNNSLVNLGVSVDTRRIFVSGASAGADMSVILGATYPDLYAAIGSFAGCAYYVCADETGELTYTAMGDFARVMPVFVAQGSADPLNNAALSEGLVQQWLGTDDLADDGSANLSISRVPTIEPRSSDPGDGNGYVYTIDHYSDSNGCPLINMYLIQGLAHNYPYGDGTMGGAITGSNEGTYVDPKGPDVTTASYHFFMEHPMPETGRGDSCHPPAAVDDAALTAFETPVDVDVLANDSDADDDSLTVVAVSDPPNGSVVNHGGYVTYTPDTGFSGAETFTYTVGDGDGNGGTDTAQVSVTVAERPNQPPKATDDQANTNEGSAVTIDVLSNDTDPDGDALLVGAVTQGLHGAVTNNLTNVTYTPQSSFDGTDLFTYQACDPDNACDTASVTVTVNPVNHPPDAADDLATTDEETPVTINVLGNDSDPDGDELTVDSVTQGLHGSVTNNSSSVTYSPNAGFSGTDVFTYQGCDADEACDAATVTVSVSPVNHRPVAIDDTGSTNEDGPITLDVLGNDSDPDSDSLIVGSVTQGLYGSVTNNLTDVTYIPDADFSGTDSFTYQACDSDNFCDTATVSVSVSSVNDPPVAAADLATTDEDSAVAISVLANDSDPDGDTLTVGSVAQGSHGSVTNNGTNVTYTPGPNYNGGDSFTYEACDPTNACDSATVEVTVNPVNDPPTAGGDLSTTDEDTPVTISVLANDSDPDGDTLIVGSVTQGSNGSVTNNGTNVTYAAEPNYNGGDSFTYTACDVYAACVTASVSVVVSPVNDPPEALDDSASTDPGTPVTISVLDNDSDVDGDPITVTGVTDPANGSAVNNGGGSVTYSPDPGFSGTDSFEYEVSDGHGGVDTASVTIEVRQPAPGKKIIFAKALDGHGCSSVEWHFVINQIIPGPDAAPATIRVVWENGAVADVPLGKFGGKAAHYSTSLNLLSRVVSASAQIYEDWSGAFNLSAGPC